MATIDIIRDVLVDNLDLDPEAITEDATLETLGLDSLDVAELICEAEDRFDIDFGELEGIETVGQIVAHIDSLK